MRLSGDKHNPSVPFVGDEVIGRRDVASACSKSGSRGAGVEDASSRIKDSTFSELVGLSSIREKGLFLHRLCLLLGQADCRSGEEGARLPRKRCAIQ